VRRIGLHVLAFTLIVAFGVDAFEAASSAAPSSGSPCARVVQAPHYSHVVWIVLENVGYQVVGSPQAPYLNRVIASCALATNDHAVSHPSLPNYLALTAGSTFGIADDHEPLLHRLSAPTIFSQLKGNWRAYAESMPAPCDTVTSGTYAARHNPAVYFINLHAACVRRDVPLGRRMNLSAAFTFIAPNVCDDMHSCPIATGDAWLARILPELEASPQYRAHSLAIFITVDESDSSASNLVPTVVIAPSVPKGLRVAVAFSHYSLLATTEQLLGLAKLAHARAARSMLRAFHL